MKSNSTPSLENGIRSAMEAVRDFPDCFWWWNQEFKPSTRQDIEEIIRSLRTNGGHRAWERAQKLQQCL